MKRLNPLWNCGKCNGVCVFTSSKEELEGMFTKCHFCGAYHCRETESQSIYLVAGKIPVCRSHVKLCAAAIEEATPESED